ncbi:MAG: glutamate--tRNA ligase, partial [Rickettsiales bacterium]
YDLPTSNDIGGLIVGDIGEYEKGKDIIVETKSNDLQRITKLHPSYMSLQYPLLFPYGEDGFRPDLKLNTNHLQKQPLRKRIPMRAYYCYQTHKETELKKEEAKNNNVQYIYDKKWRDTSLIPPIGVKPVIRLKAESIGETVIDDLVQGSVTFPNSEIEDLILVRSDNTPTYMLAVVVDDHDMNITHVIRGDDHLTNTPKQIQIYDAAGWQVPKFAHIPLIHGDDGSKLSKRHGALGVGAYIDMGYLPDAVNNYLLRLGWSHGDDEFISKEESIKWFNLESIGRSPSRIDFKKLENVNAHYLKETDNSKLLKLIKPLIEYNLNIQLNDKKLTILNNAVDDLKIRAKNIIELASIAEIFVIRPPINDDFKKLINDNSEQLNKIK